MQRRRFIQKMALMGAAGVIPSRMLAGMEISKLTILHTNDVHSRIEPFPLDGSQRSGLGGATRRAALIEQIRAEEDQVLLLDAGDIFQGTPYFNYFGGEIELKLMSAMHYDAATIGNHDFDAGIDRLNEVLPLANFPLLSANYDFGDTPLGGKVPGYKVFEKGPLRVGVFGLGIELKGLVPATLSGNTQYLEPVGVARRVARQLKRKENCDYVICLSHLGYRYRDQSISDVVLAENSRHIDLIIGGHTHTFLDRPVVVQNEKGRNVLINQVGWGGMVLGRLDVYFEQNSGQKCGDCANILIDKPLAKKQ